MFTIQLRWCYSLSVLHFLVVQEPIHCEHILLLSLRHSVTRPFSPLSSISRDTDFFSEGLVIVV